MKKIKYLFILFAMVAVLGSVAEAQVVSTTTLKTREQLRAFFGIPAVGLKPAGILNQIIGALDQNKVAMQQELANLQKPIRVIYPNGGQQFPNPTWLSSIHYNTSMARQTHYGYIVSKDLTKRYLVGTMNSSPASTTLPVSLNQLPIPAGDYYAMVCVDCPYASSSPQVFDLSDNTFSFLNGNTVAAAQCGTANGVPSSVPPSVNLCRTGTASSIYASGESVWNWNCGVPTINSYVQCSAPISASIRTTLISASSTVIQQNPGIDNDQGLFKMRFSVEAIGEDAFLSTALNTINYGYFVQKNGTIIPYNSLSSNLVDLSGSVRTSQGNFRVDEGHTGVFEINVVVPLGGGLTAGAYRLGLSGLKWDTQDVSSLRLHHPITPNYATNYQSLSSTSRQDQAANLQSALQELLKQLKESLGN